jgi:YgiT-type zinc finger domain-containing protein
MQIHKIEDTGLYIVVSERIIKNIEDSCAFCEEEMEYQNKMVRFRYKGQTIYVENVPVWVCNHCGEEYFDAYVYKHLEEIARQRERTQRQISFPLATFEMVAA